MKPVVIVIGGTDSSGGAGVSRDVATLTELGCEARPVITAVTAQTNAAVHAVMAIPPHQVAAQLSAALATGQVSAVKTGMLHSAQTITALTSILKGFGRLPLVIDPVLVSSSGTQLLAPDAIAAIKQHLLPLCTLVTPNMPEASMLTGSQTAEIQAKSLLDCGAGAVLIKGGHGIGDRSVDRLFQENKPTIESSNPRLNATLRGTGCMLASAIAAYLSRGKDATEACSLATDFVFDKLHRAESWSQSVAGLFDHAGRSEQ